MPTDNEHKPTKDNGVKIKTESLSKTALVDIVSAGRDAGIIKDCLIVVVHKHDLVSQLNVIHKKLDKIGEDMRNKRLSQKAFTKLSEKKRRLSISGSKKIKQYNSLPDSTNEVPHAN